jgi:isoamylase
VFRRRQFFQGTPAPDAPRDDLDWYRSDGIEMTPEDWSESFARAVAVALSGDTGDPTRRDDPFLLLLNSYWEPLEFTVPDPLRDLGWRVEIDTEHPDAAGREVDASAAVTLTGRSLMLLHGTQPSS